MKACVLIPTYNEAGNIGKLLDSLIKVGKSLKGFELHILVLDDSSPDGTGDIVSKYAVLHKNVHLMTGKKEGLGAAYIRGFKYTMDKFGVIVTMDADLSHDPQKVPEFLEQIRLGYDVVIGSRYVNGGSIPDWNLQRRIVSRAGNFFARIVGGLYKVRDCTSGYRAIRTDMLKKIDFKYLATKGYAFLTTSLYELYTAGAKVKEIPIVFHDRKVGVTKLTKADMARFFLNSCRLRLKTGHRFTKFVTVGFSGVIVNMLALWFFTQIEGLPLLAAGAIAIELSIIYNFVLNDIYTFRDSRGVSGFIVRLLKFNSVALYGFLVNLSALYLLTEYTGFYYLLSNLIGIFAATAFNYIAVIDWTWRVGKAVRTKDKAESLITSLVK